MKSNFLKYAFLSFFTLVYVLPTYAQPGGGGGGFEDDGEYEQAPIDNWMLILALAGIAIGIYMVTKYNKKAVA